MIEADPAVVRKDICPSVSMVFKTEVSAMVRIKCCWHWAGVLVPSFFLKIPTFEKRWGGGLLGWTASAIMKLYLIDRYHKENPMRNLSLLLASLVLCCLLVPTTTHAQYDRPTIIRFQVAPQEPYTIDAIEAGDAQATLLINVENLGDHALVVDQLVINDWQRLAFGSPLQANDQRTITLQHPLNFGPLTYRLSILDAGGVVLDQALDVYNYPAHEFPPTIDRFRADVSTLDSGRLTVLWEVSNRQPYTNLVFEQVLADASVISVELPRDFAWIPSVGAGELAPQLDASGAPVHLRLRVVDYLTDTTLAERDLVLGGSAGDDPVILNFYAEPDPVARGGTVTVYWQVQNAEIVQIAQVSPTGRYLRSTEEIAQDGSRAFTILASDFYTATFFIYAGDRLGNGITDTLDVAVSCPYTFFVATEATTDTCPVQAEATFPGAYQLFERGEAIWRGDRGEIIVLYGSGTYETFPDTYVEGETIAYPDGIATPTPQGTATPTPETALTVPIRGFGKVWANNSSVRNGLGFAIGTEVGYGIVGQDVADGTTERNYSYSYFTYPDGSVVELNPDGTWRKIA